MADSSKTVVIGGGVSGLATAYFLGKLGIRPTLVEKSNRLGGLIQTDLVEGCQLEAGPDSFLAAKGSVAQLAGELGDLADQMIGSNDAQRRIYVVRDGRLVPMPCGMVMMAPAEWGPVLRSELFSVKTKLRFLLEPFTSPRHRSDDVSVGQLVLEHFGKEVLEYLAEPLLAGVYGGDSAALSAESVLPRFVGYERDYGSLIKGVRRETRQQPHSGGIFRSFSGGMQSLTDALINAIRASSEVVHAEVTQVEEGTGGGWRVKAKGEWISADSVVLACTSHVASNLLESAAPSLSGALAKIPYSSAILATFVYRRSELMHPLDGFGFLVPSAERETVAAATWINTKFPTRLPKEFAAIRAFIVGSDAAGLLHASAEEIVQVVRGQLDRIMGIKSDPLFYKIAFWPASMPQYTVGHRERRQFINGCLTCLEGLYLVGNAYEGVGIPDCVRLAKEAAGQIATRLLHGE